MKKVYAYLHTHWDREWYREFEEFRLRLVEVTDDILNKLERKEIESFYFDGQTSAIEDYLEIKPDNCQKIKDFIKEKRLFIGPYFCSTDSFLVDAESLIKNLQLGIKYSKDFGCHDYIAYHSDTFGHSSHISQIVKYFKIPNAIFWRGLGELESEFLFRDLKSTYLIEGYFHDYFSADVSYEKKAEFLKRTLDRIAEYSSDCMLLPLGADHLAAPDNIKEQIEVVNKLLDGYEIILTTPFEYFEKVKNNHKKNVTGEFRDTKRNFILPGVYSSRIDLKQQNAKLQFELARKTQPLQAICSRLGLSKDFQSEVDYAYKELIKNHAHDSIYGCSVDNVHAENNMRFQKVSQASRAVINCVKRDIYTAKKLSVINLSNFELNGALKIKTIDKIEKKFNPQLISTEEGFPPTKVYSINQIPITEDYTKIYEYLIDLKNIEQFSSLPVSEDSIEKTSTLNISSDSIENSKIKLSVTDGKIEMQDKTQNKTYFDFIKIIDRADIGDSYNFGSLKGDKPIVSRIIKTRIKEKGHIRSILEIVFEILIPEKSRESGRSKILKNNRIYVQAVLENQNDYVEFKIDWENKSKDHQLQVELNLPESIKETESDELAGFIKREFDPEYNIYELLPAPRGVELKHNLAPLQKCIVTQGTGVITEGLQEYEIYKNRLRLTILRSTGTISNPHNPTRGTPAGPPLPTPDLQRLGKNSARFAVCFKDNAPAMIKDIEKFYGTAFLVNSDLKEQEFFKCDNENFIVSTIKTNKDNGLIVRFLNFSDTKQIFSFKTDLTNEGIFICDSEENPILPFKITEIEGNSFITILIK